MSPESPREEKPSKAKKTGPDWLQSLTRLRPGWPRRLVIAVVVIVLFLGLGSLISRLLTDL